MKNTYSREIANVIREFLDNDDWHYSFDEKKGMFRFGLTLKSKLKNIKYYVDVKEDEFICYAVSPVGGDEDDSKMMASLAEFLCMANYGLKNGNFEFDFRDGEIRYKSFVDCDRVIPSKEVVHNAVYCIATMFKHYSPGILGIIFNDMSAKDAIDMVEGKSLEDELLSMLSSLDGDSDSPDVQEMISQLASRLGIAEGDNVDGVSSESDESACTDVDISTQESSVNNGVKTDLFQAGGAA